MRIRLWLGLLLVILVVLAPLFSRWYTDWLWFEEVGYLRIFWIPLISALGWRPSLGESCSCCSG